MSIPTSRASQYQLTALRRRQPRVLAIDRRRNGRVLGSDIERSRREAPRARFQFALQLADQFDDLRGGEQRHRRAGRKLCCRRRLPVDGDWYADEGYDRADGQNGEKLLDHEFPPFCTAV